MIDNLKQAYPEPPIYDVAIVGAGFGGSMVAVHLAGAFGSNGQIALIERTGRFGAGVAYGTPSPLHLLNVPVAKMSAFPDDPGHFLRWLEANPQAWIQAGLTGIGGSTFVPRPLYCAYLRSILNEVKGHVRHISREAVDIQRLLDGTQRVVFSDGSSLLARKIVLALGNFPPGHPKLPDRHFHQSPRYLRDPWSADTLERLSAPGDILILGSGLTGLDLLQLLQRRKHEGIIHVLSRRGLFPQPHQLAPAWQLTLAPEQLPRSVRGLLRFLRAEVNVAMRQGVTWRAVIDALRPHTQQLWIDLPQVEKRRFLRHLRPYWESHRHRTAPQVLAVKTELERAGRLRCHRGRLLEITEVDDHLRATFIPTGSSQPIVARLSYVINCTGPECNFQQLDDPLIVQLFARGLIRPDPLFLGLDVDPSGALINAYGQPSGDLFTLGSPRKGKLMETTAVPEIRAQAAALARRLAEDLHEPFKSFGTSELDPAYTFDI